MNVSNHAEDDCPSIDGGPWKIFVGAGEAQHAVIVLNTPLNFQEEVAPLIISVWNAAIVRITVDGGTDRWMEWTNQCCRNSSSSSSSAVVHPPDLVTGDMDSIAPQTLEYFATQPDCTNVVYTRDQNATDFTKALIELVRYLDLDARGVKRRRLRDVLVLSDMSGRFDQTLSNINSLYMARDILPDVDVYLLSACSITWLLAPHVQHRIYVPRNLRDERKCCGLIPIGGKCRVTTSGLRWNLSDSALEFGKLVSSSNTYDGRESTVVIHTDNMLTWTMEIDSYLLHQSKQVSAVR